MRKRIVMVVEDDVATRRTIARGLAREGWAVVEAENGRVALERLRETTPALILLDLMMPEMDGITLLEHIKRLAPETAVVIMTAYGTVEKAVSAIKKGAYDFLLKPVTPDTVEHVLLRITEMMSLKTENELLRKDLEHRFQNMIGKSKIMKEIFDLVQSVAAARAETRRSTMYMGRLTSATMATPTSSSPSTTP